MGTIYYKGQYASTTLSKAGGLNATDTSGLVVASIPSSVDEDKPSIICITWADPLDTDDCEWITYTSIDSGTKELQGVTRGAEGFSAKTHDNGCTIAWTSSRSFTNNVADKLMGVDTTVFTDSNGNELLKTSKVASAVNEITVKNAATGDNPGFSATGEDDTGMTFENKGGEEMLILDSIASSVNEVTMKSAATGDPPEVLATGDDTNIDLALTAKGTGKIKQDAIYQTPQTSTPDAAGTDTLDLSTGNEFRITMPAGNITIAISNETDGQKFIISILQDGTGSREVTWMGTVKWAGGSAPTLTTTADKRDIFGFVVTGADQYDGVIVGQDI